MLIVLLSWISIISPERFATSTPREYFALRTPPNRFCPTQLCVCHWFFYGSAPSPCGRDTVGNPVSIAHSPAFLFMFLYTTSRGSLVFCCNYKIIAPLSSFLIVTLLQYQLYYAFHLSVALFIHIINNGWFSSELN